MKSLEEAEKEKDDARRLAAEIRARRARSEFRVQLYFIIIASIKLTCESFAAGHDKRLSKLRSNIHSYSGTT
jgi:hypothetical protein